MKEYQAEADLQTKRLSGRGVGEGLQDRSPFPWSPGPLGSTPALSDRCRLSHLVLPPQARAQAVPHFLELYQMGTRAHGMETLLS